MDSMCFIYDVNFKKFAGKHGLRAEEEINGKVYFLFVDPGHCWNISECRQFGAWCHLLGEHGRHGEDARKFHEDKKKQWHILRITLLRSMVKSSGISAYRRAYEYCFRSRSFEIWKQGGWNYWEAAGIWDSDISNIPYSYCWQLWINSGCKSGSSYTTSGDEHALCLSGATWNEILGSTDCWSQKMIPTTFQWWTDVMNSILRVSLDERLFLRCLGFWVRKWCHSRSRSSSIG